MSEPNTDLQPGDIVELDGNQCVVCTKTLLLGEIGQRSISWLSLLLAYFYDVGERVEFKCLIRLPTEVKATGRLLLQEVLPSVDLVKQNPFWWVLSKQSVQPFHLVVKDNEIVGYNLHSAVDNSWRDGAAFAPASVTPAS